MSDTSILDTDKTRNLIVQSYRDQIAQIQAALTAAPNDPQLLRDLETARWHLGRHTGTAEEGAA